MGSPAPRRRGRAPPEARGGSRPGAARARRWRRRSTGCARPTPARRRRRWCRRSGCCAPWECLLRSGRRGLWLAGQAAAACATRSRLGSARPRPATGAAAGPSGRRAPSAPRAASHHARHSAMAQSWTRGSREACHTGALKLERPETGSCARDARLPA